MAASSNLDISDLAVPILVSTTSVFYGINSVAGDIAVTGTYACMIDYSAGLVLVDVQNPMAPVVKARYPANLALGVSANNGYCSVFARTGDVTIVDLNQLPSPLLLGEWDGPGFARAIAASQDYAYIAGTDGFRVLDISNPASPTTAGVISDNFQNANLAVSGNIAVLANNDVLQLVDVSNPAAPTVVAYYDDGNMSRP